jgi:hypothetical protein
MKKDNRRHKRFPVVKDMAEPVDLFVLDGAHPQDLPAVLTNISSGGMSLVVFAHVNGATKLKMLLNVPGLEGLEVQGRVAWTHAKGDMTTVGVEFNHVSADAVRKINHMAEGYQDCELKLSFGVKDVCIKECSFWPLCAKPVKLKH